MIDTNSLAILIGALQQKSAAAPSGNLVLILVTLTPLLMAVTAWFSKKTATSVEAIHKSVNSEREAAVKEIKELKAVVLDLSEKIAFTEGQKENAAQELLTAAVVAAAQKVQAESNQPNSG